MKNYEIEAAWEYHNGTKHPNGMMLKRFHYYDPTRRSVPYKIYKGIDSLSLPLDKSNTIPALKAISNTIEHRENHIPNLHIISEILYFSSGITKIIRYPGIGSVEFRAAACTGALFHTELYVVCKDVENLKDGVYHFDPKGMRLDILRKGDYRGIIVEACGNDIDVQHAPVIFVYSDIFTRNSVKYQAREYRHAFWDCGTILANTLAVSTAHSVSTKLIMGFVDEKINSLLDLNSDKESSIAVLSMGFTKEAIAYPAPQVGIINLKTEPLSNYDFDDPHIQKIHQSSSLSSVKEVREWKGKTPKIAMQKVLENIFSLEPFGENEIPKDTIEGVIIRRGSARKFSREPISFRQLSTIIYYSTRGIPADFLGPLGNSLIHLYLIVNAVDGLKAGSYVYNREQNGLQLLREGMFRHVAGNLGLDQDLSADGSVAVFFMTDLDAVLKRFGNRGYRAAQLEASITGGKFYLAAYAQKLGATGLTFYDDSVTQFFSPHAKDKSVMFMVVLGKKAIK